MVMCALSSFAIISLRKREQIKLVVFLLYRSLHVRVFVCLCFYVSSSRFHGLVCDLRFSHALVILTCLMAQLRSLSAGSRIGPDLLNYYIMRYRNAIMLCIV